MLALGAVGSYPTFSPLPSGAARPCGRRRTMAVCFLWHCPSGHLAVSPPACISLAGRVTRHRALWSSDFPPRVKARGEPPLLRNRGRQYDLPVHNARGASRPPAILALTRFRAPGRGSWPTTTAFPDVGRVPSPGGKALHPHRELVAAKPQPPVDMVNRARDCRARQPMFDREPRSTCGCQSYPHSI